MDKLKLSPEQQIIFQAALHDAYEGGSRDATFLANSTYQLVDGSEKILGNITKQYCELEDVSKDTATEAT